MDLRGRHEDLRARIARACARAGRPADSVVLIAISKTLPAEAIREAHALGVRDFGENKVQELLSKAPLLEDLGIRWHMVGHLQTNKVRGALAHASMIQSVDSAHLAQRIDSLVAEGSKIEVLLQINTSGEESKFGVAPRDLDALVSAIRPLDRLEVRGLMTLGPLTDDEEAIRSSFRTLRSLLPVARLHFPGASILSMGMSGDFEIAIEEGATHIRVGAALFGARI
ncbi:MAG: YggS family pyridoxal phosphate-dependent enzyme [Candidatus Eisenbacteria bacterium]|nr:YggS family pyridoxal phosphate-dependent enzyme [Candidatus Eisenbacteria bacterium]